MKRVDCLCWWLTSDRGFAVDCHDENAELIRSTAFLTIPPGGGHAAALAKLAVLREFFGVEERNVVHDDDTEAQMLRSENETNERRDFLSRCEREMSR